MLRNFNVQEILLILLVILVIFGGRRLPELGRGLGRGLRNFRRALSGNEDPEADESGRPEAAKEESPGQKPDQPKG